MLRLKQKTRPTSGNQGSGWVLLDKENEFLIFFDFLLLKLIFQESEHDLDFFSNEKQGLIG